jgi:formate hydrogenlyase subunit 3/multisubunit Na+/H+ antiporter MnhD subunit
MTPLWIIVVPWIMAPWVYLFRRRSTIAALLSAGTSLAVAVICFLLSPDQTVWILGRGLLFDPWRRGLLVFLFAGAVLLFLYSWHLSQGWSFFPFLLVTLGLLAGSAMVDNFLLAVLLLELAGIILAFLIQGGPRADPRVAMGYLVPLIIAGSCLIFSTHLFDLVALYPEDLASVRLAMTTLTLGFGILLAVVPFHLFLPAVTQEAPPMVATFLLGFYQVVALSLMVGLLDRQPGLGSEAFDLLLVAGLITALGGGVFAFLERAPGRLLAYGAISDLGLILVGLGTASGVGVAGAMAHLINRSLAIALVAMSWGVISERYGGQRSVMPMGVARALPWATLGYILGGLTLAGFPLTGFATRWPIYLALLPHNPLYTFGLILGGLGIAWGYLRSLTPILGRGERPPGGREPVLVAMMIVALVGTSLLLGIYPDYLLEPLRNMVEGFSFVGG